MGRRIVEEIRAAGYDVVAPRSDEFDLETGSGVRDFFRARRESGAPVGCVVHSAAYYGGIGICQTDPLGLAVRNSRMSSTIFEESARAQVGKFVSVGSTCAYPGHLDGEMTEDMLFSGRCHPSVEAYGFSKRLQLVMMTAAYRQYGMECVQLSLTNLYGEHDVFQEYRSHVVSAVIKKMADAKLSGGRARLWGTGKPTRQFLYVGDAARTIAAAIDFAHDGEPINVGGEEISIKALAHLIADMIGVPQEMIEWDTSKPDGVARKVVDETKIRRLLPSHGHIPFKEGLRKTIDWYLANKEDADNRP